MNDSRQSLYYSVNYLDGKVLDNKYIRNCTGHLMFVLIILSFEILIYISFFRLFVGIGKIDKCVAIFSKDRTLFIRFILFGER